MPSIYPKTSLASVHPAFPSAPKEGRNEIKVAQRVTRSIVPRALLHLDDHANERITVSSLTFSSVGPPSRPCTASRRKNSQQKRQTTQKTLNSLSFLPFL